MGDLSCEPGKRIPASDIVEAINEKALDSEFQDHQNNKENPHEVTIEQIGAAPLVHTHVESDITDLDKYTQDEVDSKDQAIQDDLDIHKGNTDNPHNTTYENIGGTQPAPVAHVHTEDEIVDLDKYTQLEVDNKDQSIQNDIDGHKNNVANPHAVTKAQVGLSNVDNTSDMLKPISSATQVEIDRLDLKDAELTAEQILKTQWKGNWVPNVYDAQDMVKDGSWTMIANKETGDRAAPQSIGEPFNTYNGIPPADSSVSARQIIYGTQFEFAEPGYIQAYRVYVRAGNNYEIILVEDPDGAKQAMFVNNFVADETGWRTFTLVEEPVGAGTKFQMLAIVDEPDPAPATWSGQWNYITPQNDTIPLVGQAIHSSKSLSSIRFADIDNNGVDRSAELLALNIGDKINFGAMTWAIQSILDGGSYVELGVSPATQVSANIGDFIFETVAAVPLSYFEDVDYWLTNFTGQVYGCFIVDDSYENIVPNDNAYGMDITVQQAYVSPDWDLVATSEATGGGGSGASFATDEEVLEGIVLDKSVSPSTLNTKVPTEGTDGYALIKKSTGNEWGAIPSAARMAGVGFDHYGAVAPLGALVCDSSEYSQAMYPELYAVIGDLYNTFNGMAAPAAGNFRVPPQAVDGKGLFSRGVGEGAVGDFQDGDNKAHVHSGPSHVHSANHNHSASSGTGGGHNHSLQGSTDVRSVNRYISGAATVSVALKGTVYTNTVAAHSHTVSVATKTMNTGAGGTEDTGSSGGDETRPVSITTLKCIWTGQ